MYINTKKRREKDREEERQLNAVKFNVNWLSCALRNEINVDDDDNDDDGDEDPNNNRLSQALATVLFSFNLHLYIFRFELERSNF